MARISTAELERRLELARSHREEEPAFFRCLLDAKVYAHAPASDDHSRLRLLQFRHPDGFHAVPFFTSIEKARPPTGIAAKIIPLLGRQFLELTRGATVMLNPNDGGCVLYPEEVDALLKTGAVARIEKIHLANDFSFLVSDQTKPPSWLMSCLMGLYSQLSFVQVAYLLEVAPSHAPAERTLLIVLGVAPEHAERAVRASITEIQPFCAHNDVALDITTFDPAKETPAYLRQRGVERFFGPPLK
ncbi:SseB family protein [Thermomonas fusca]|uniref:SseB family protein n=1 Tax=Thermomonas fusca TaxID=215690 RepID=UPI0006888445|nr:SseB family protein [Thermomonas fusca]